MNCHPTLCGMLAEVQDGKLKSVRGDPENPDSRGFLCIRGQASREIIENPGRLMFPLVRDRRSDAFRRASWDQAIGRIAASIERSPPAATAFWPGHGTFASNYGTRISAQMMARFANIHGSQFWSPIIVCWGLGAFGLALTGMLETHTKEDMGAHSQLILMWAANLASQPNTARYLLEAKRRGAYVVTIDVRQTEASAKSDEVLLIKPGSDTALALAMIHVICAEHLHDAAFVAQHSVGFEALAGHVEQYTPQWAAQRTGISVDQIVALARRYAGTRPAMIVLGGSSMHKGANGWLAGRAIACLPGLTGNIGIAGGGFGPRHGSAAHGRGLGNITAADRRTPGSAMPNQMSAITAALREGRIHNLLLMGTNMMSSFADTSALAVGLSKTRLLVSYDLFLNDTARQFADVVLPATAWLEELGCKATNTHLYLMPPALTPAGETRSLHDLIKGLAERLNLEDFYPWANEEGMINAVLDHPCTGPATVASLTAQGGFTAMNVSHIANPNRVFDTPSRKIEFYSAQAEILGLGALPEYQDSTAAATSSALAADRSFPLTLTQGRTLAHFHGFYNNGQELPTLARRENEPHLWLSQADAASRSINHGAAIRIFNRRGAMMARAHVTERIQAGTVWMRDGWPGLNSLTEGKAVLPDAAVDLFAFAAGQATYDTQIEVTLASRLDLALTLIQD